jgi:N-acetylmuramoyl-L-alanine amidase
MGQPTYDHIIIAGEKYRVSGGVRVVTYDDPGGYSFEKRRQEAIDASGLAGYGRRTHKGGNVRDMETLQKVVHQVVLHTDMTSDSRGCFNVLVARGLSTHFMIDWDGTIFQGLDLMAEAYHAGEANAGSIGIDMNNLLRNLVREPSSPPHPPAHARFADMSKREYRRPPSRRMRINGGDVRNYGYTDAQYQSLIALMKVLVKVFDRLQPFPPLNERGEIVENMLEDWAGFDGFLGHWHVTPDRWDPGPGFDWHRVYHGLAREHNAFPVELEEGLNIATLLEPEKVRTYAERYFANNEDSEDGGWYPMGKNQNWHGGVHLHTPAATPVFAMFDGVVVAGRFGPALSELGSNNFLVLRHEIEVPGGTPDKPNHIVFYSLTMHLAAMEMGKVSEASPDWVRALHRVHSGLTEEEEKALAELRASKVEPDGGREEGSGDEPAEGFTVDEAEAGAAVLGIGEHLAAFKRGEIALVPWEEQPVRVSSGEQIGTVGHFGPPGEPEPMIHVEIFADAGWNRALDMGVHGRWLSELEPDFGDDLFVEDKAILRLFETSSALVQRGSMMPRRVVAPDTIEYFFSTRDVAVEEKRWLRRVVARHVSEWSDRVDWLSALAKGEGWTLKTRELRRAIEGSGVFRETLRQVLPFIWLTEEVASHMGLDTREWDGVVTTFHPIHFLMWLTYHASQRIQVISRGLSLHQIKRALAIEEKKRESGLARQSNACVHAAIEIEDVEATEASEVLEQLFDSTDQGDWKITRD